MLFKAQTSGFKLQSGTKKINFNSVNLVNTKKYSNDIFKDNNGRSTLPNGTYNVCISVLTKETNEVLCSSFNNYEIINFSQTKLISPINKEIINGKFPIFTWHQSLNQSIGENVTYEITVVQIHNGQTPQEAMQLNPVVLKRNNIHSELFEYPIKKSRLLEGNRYVWKVNSKIDNKILSESEIWEFEFVNESKNSITIEENVNDNDSLSYINYDKIKTIGQR